MPITGIAISDRLNLNPRKDMIQKVVVVPKLAPITTPTACIKERRRACTKLTTMTVVADEDWTRQVTRKPVVTPASRFPVIDLRMLRRRSPEIFWMDSLISRIPNRKNAKASED